MTTEVDMKDVELNEVDPEKQPMTGGGAGNGDAVSPVTEKNGSVKVKIPEEQESKFTGLSKEELLRVAGTPGWVKTRWALLILFWLGWLGMLAGAVVIIIQAPRCKPLPEMNWWDNGPLYQIGDVNAFTQDSKLAGLQKKIDSIGDLKVKGLIIGPIHVSSADKPEDLNLKEISADTGSLEELKGVLEAAHKKSIPVVLDLTPNYKGLNPWFSNGSVARVAEEIKSATDHWLEEGVDGILLHGVERTATMDSFWTSMKEAINNRTTEEKKPALFGVTTATSADEVKRQLNMTGVDLLLSRVLNKKIGVEAAQVVESLSSVENKSLAWNIGDRVWGHMASIVGSQLKLSQLLLLTLPGTPVFNYGDEIGLQDTENLYPNMVWLKDMNDTEEVEKKQGHLSFFKALSELRGKERSLLHGEYIPLSMSSTAMAYIRKWDQNERYIVVLNWDSTNPFTLQEPLHKELPEKATVVLSTDTNIQPDDSVSLAELKVEPQQAVLLKFPYTP